MVHNYYQQPGGEDVVFAAEADLLRRYGHSVLEYTEDNARINGMNRFRVAVQTIWSSPSRERILKLMLAERPDVIHFHNTFPLVSPSVYSACRDLDIPVVQSLHNPRLLCPAATFYRNGQICEDCLGKTIPWPAMLHGQATGALECKRRGRVDAHCAPVAQDLGEAHRCLRRVHGVLPAKIYQRRIAGRQTDRKASLCFSGPGEENAGARSQAAFIGRLQPEKGVLTLLRAWQRAPVIPLRIVGEGPLKNEVQSFINAHGLDNIISVFGRQDRDSVMAIIKQSRFLVWPSEGHYETFGLVAVEAFACGVPVIFARGSDGGDVEDGRMGLLLIQGDPEGPRGQGSLGGRAYGCDSANGRGTPAANMSRDTPLRKTMKCFWGFTKKLSLRHGIDAEALVQILRCLFFGAIFLLGAPVISFGAQESQEQGNRTIHVNSGHPSASDENSGAEERPLASVTKAAELAQRNNRSRIGTRVIIHPGTYRESIQLENHPKDTNASMIFEAEQKDTAIISGSDVWDGWQREGNTNVYSHAWPHRWGLQPNPWEQDKITLNPIVRRREMIFADGKLLRQVLSMPELQTGSFYVRRGKATVYLSLTPETKIGGTVIEVATRSGLLKVNGKRNIAFRGLVFQHDNSTFGDSAVAVKNSSRILMEDCKVQWNNWSALDFISSDNIIARRNAVTPTAEPA
jgi:glycosyltransferase involved in cell wall biosynthesis